MILPGKHLRQERALLGVGAEILSHLRQNRTVSELWERIRISPIRVIYPLNYDWFVLSLVFLFMIQAIDIANGTIIMKERR